MSATRQAQLHDVLGTILTSDCHSAQAPMDAYSLIFVMVEEQMKMKIQLKDKGPLSDYAEVYHFVRDSLAEHMRTKVNKAENIHDLVNIEQRQKPLDLVQASCSYLRRHYIERTNAEDIVAFARRTFLEAKHETVLANPLWLDEWLKNAIDGVEDGTELTEDTKKAGQLILEAYSERQDDYETNFGDPFIRAAVAHYHEKAKELAAEDDPVAYQQKKHDIMCLEAARGEVYLHESQRRDYLDTLAELFDLGDEKFQR